jgi:hypothetical protein
MNEKIDEAIKNLGEKKYLTKADRTFLISRLTTLKSVILGEETLIVPFQHRKNIGWIKRKVLKRVKRKITKEVGYMIDATHMRAGDAIEVVYTLKLNADNYTYAVPIS